MKRIIIFSSLIGWLVIFCLSTGVFESLFMFLLFGVLPGTNTVLSAQYMTIFCYFAAFTVIVFAFRKQLQHLFKSASSTHHHSQA